MKSIIVSALVLLCLSATAQQDTPKAAFLEKWENSKNYLLQFAEAMPESLYGYKPTERQMSFEAQLEHIKMNMEWLGTSYFSAKEYRREIATVPTSKAETIASLSKAFDTVSAQIKLTSDKQLTETVNFFAGPKSKLQLLNLLQDHVTHHRGQLIVYLNLNGIDPPNYVGW